MTRVLLIGALVATLFWVYSIVDCALQPPTRHRGVSKPIWILIVVIIPVLGGILWFIVGRARPSSARPSRAPDDDPDFLGRIGSISDQDERIRRLEEELAQLDAEDDDPRWQRPGTDAGTTGAAGATGATAAGATDAALPDAPPPADGDDDARGQRGAHG